MDFLGGGAASGRDWFSINAFHWAAPTGATLPTANTKGY